MRAFLTALLLAGPAAIGRAGPLASLEDAAALGPAAAAYAFDGGRSPAGALPLEGSAAPLPAQADAPKPIPVLAPERIPSAIPDIGGPPSRNAMDSLRKGALTAGILMAMAGSFLWLFNPALLLLLGGGLLLVILADKLPGGAS